MESIRGKTISFVQRPSHNVFLTTPFSQRFSHNVFLITFFLQRFPNICEIPKKHHDKRVSVIFFYVPKSPNQYYSKLRQNFNFEQIQIKFIRLTTAHIYVLTMCRMKTKPIEGYPIVRTSPIENHAKLKKSAFMKIRKMSITFTKICFFF